MIETPVRPLMTTCVVDMGSAKISTLTKIRAEHICVDPSTMKPNLKFVIDATGIVFVTVLSSVKRLIESIPKPSKKVAKATIVDIFAFLLT